MELARFANKYFNDKEPWVTRRSNLKRCRTTLNLCAQTTRSLAVLMNPFLPFTSEKIWKMLKVPGKIEQAAWDEIGELQLPDGHQFGKPQILFQKIEDDIIQKEVDRLKAIQVKMQKEKDAKDMSTITLDEFQKVELKTAKVLEAEAIPKAKKLLKLQVDVGGENRQLVAGIAQYYQPEELVGKNIVIVANLEPATIRGVESQGMLLAVQDDNQLTLVTTERDVSPGKPVS
ncbi:methionine--tRNA ligase subunit beta [Candidatus Saccharibacteria bacterium]|nr:methionine--tRNA ligase subunit beta [Candidatus Saccharibacteria bacterium]NIW79754.1 methionine--tRNA ligase subunit beta [Calditrichia bacterium]